MGERDEEGGNIKRTFLKNNNKNLTKPSTLDKNLQVETRFVASLLNLVLLILYPPYGIVYYWTL